MKLILALLTIVGYVNTQLTVAGPSSLKNSNYDLIQKQNRTTNFTMANFGEIPWGKRILAPLAIAVPKDAEEGSIKHDACDPIKPFRQRDYPHQLPVVLVERGNCKFTTKARNIQEAGGKMAIIYDNKVELSQYISMGDDGTGDNIHIPSIFISEKKGEDLLGMYQDLKLKDQKVVIQVIFPIEQREYLDVGFYVNLPSESAQFFLEDFRDIYENFDNDHIYYYNVYQFTRGRKDANQKFIQSDNCISGGRYCCYDPDGPGTATGAEIAKEQVRRVCLETKYNTKFWLDYVYFFKEQYCKVQSYESCSAKAIAQATHLNKKLIDKASPNLYHECITDIFQDKESLDMEEQLKKIDTSGVWNWPAVHINNITYSGRYAASSVEEAICAGFKPDFQTQRCRQVIDPTNPDNFKNADKANTTGIVLIILGILLVIFVLIILGYKKYVRREMKSEVKTHVNEMVSNYIKFYEAKQKDTEN